MIGIRCCDKKSAACSGRTPIAGDLREFPNGQALDERPGRLVVLSVRPVVADLGVRQDDDLSTVRGVREDLLISGDSGVEDDLAVALGFHADAPPPKNTPVFERQNGCVAHSRTPNRSIGQ